MKEKLVVIIGPTAVGKTKTSVELAKSIDGEIISGDSMQIYRGMDIGTAKVSMEEMQGIPHYLIDIVDPTESFSVAQFQKEVQKLISDINAKGKIPIIVGGTGLYIQSVLYNYQFSEAEGDLEYRHSLEKLSQEKGQDAVYELLKKVDPKSASLIHPNNVRRVIRALEVYHKTGVGMSDYEQQRKEDSTYDYVLIGLTMERKVLYERINKRVDQMVEDGLFEEAKSLYNKGIINYQSTQAIGYKEIYEYFSGELTLDEAIEKLKRNSRRYAKRQLTWFRNKMDVDWFDMTDLDFDKKFNEILDFVAGKIHK